MTTRPEPVLTGRFVEAVEFAVAAHAAQARKGTTVPYVAHLLAVASLVLEHGGDEATAIAALLHDAPEDQGGRPMLERIRARFGPRVADIVETCSDTFEQPKPAWRARKEQYLAQLAAADVATCLVGAADKLHNARSIREGLRAEGAAIWTRFNAPPDALCWYYRSVATTLRERLAGQPGLGLVELLDETIRELWPPAPAA